MKKPVGIKILNVVLVIKLVFIPLFFVVSVLMVTINPKDTDSFIYNFQEGFIEAVGFVRSDLGDGSLVARYIGSLSFDTFVPLALVILSIIFLNKRRFKSSIVTFSLQILFSLGNILSTIIHLGLLVILIVNRKYFDQQSTETAENIQESLEA